jgi:hypothetical protein
MSSKRKIDGDDELPVKRSRTVPEASLAVESKAVARPKVSLDRLLDITALGAKMMSYLDLPARSLACGVSKKTLAISKMSESLHWDTVEFPSLQFPLAHVHMVRHMKLKSLTLADGKYGIRGRLMLGLLESEHPRQMGGLNFSSILANSKATLHKLTISATTNLSSGGVSPLANLGDWAPNLKWLKIYNVEPMNQLINLTPEQQLKLPKIEKLSIMAFGCESSASIIKLLRLFSAPGADGVVSALKGVRLSDVDYMKIRRPALKAISEQLSSMPLTYLQVDEVVLDELIFRGSIIETLEEFVLQVVNECELDDHESEDGCSQCDEEYEWKKQFCPEILGRCKALKRFDFRDHKIETKHCELLASLPCLGEVKLYVSKSGGSPYEAIKTLAKTPQLTKLSTYNSCNWTKELARMVATARECDTIETVIINDGARELQGFRITSSSAGVKPLLLDYTK